MQTERWQDVQNRTFTKWLNNKLAARELPQAADLKKDLSNGIYLIQLMEIIGDESLGRYTRNPRLRVQKVENVNKALDYIKSKGIPLTNIGAEDIVDGNLKLILGLLWTLILRFTIADISEEGLTAKEGLLLWCQRKTVEYFPDVDIQDFSRSWTSGLGFCALIHQHRPDLLDFRSLDKTKHKENMQLALDIAHKHIGIPPLIDVEDICDVERPDERSIMTYVAEYFHAFSTLDKVETAARRVERFSDVLKSSHEMHMNYELRMRSLLKKLTQTQNVWLNTVLGDNYASLKKQSNSFGRFKSSVKREWVKEKMDLESLLGTIQTNLKTYQLKKYEPPAGLRIVDLDREWKNLLNAEAKYSKIINTHIRRVKEDMRRNFAERANSFSVMLNTISAELSTLHGDWADQLEHVNFLREHIGPLETELASVQKLWNDCVEAGIEENDYTIFTYDDLNYEFSVTVDSINNKIKYLELQLSERQKRTLSQEELSEIEKVFKHFDKNKSNNLSELEFYAALASLGLVYEEEEAHAVFAKAAGEQQGVTYERFIDIVMDELEDRDSARQVIYAFCDVADGKSFVTEEDLKNSQVRPDIIKFLETTIDKCPEGYDYLKWIRTLLDDDNDDNDDGTNRN
ncbi:alpha-actinin [Schizosaccharomyces japonicus yFS275]|uniref:Alpha-actinin n=1 Tax=Schizosaccharomyces japonicus (strain yFS275 / FY16936) TaxID=402676 RepID=B6K7B3_SCHJY|nr:alpha-actinin [Schizosaccharomyces japonicus yFS275]EEB09417.2 alpha-actinin [Schizosaccharomyces japonicus yFS275]